MKVIQLVQEIPYALLRKAAANFGHFDLGNQLPSKIGSQIFNFQQKIAGAFGNDLTVKSVFNYLFNASVEGLKQNFLRPDIDMEFFILSIKVYSMLLIRFATSNPATITPKFMVQ
jgi:hypothetical protein